MSVSLFINLSAQDIGPFKLLNNADKSISSNFLFNLNNETYPLEKIGKISGLAISGTVKFFSEKALVRVILVDENYSEYLVYESYSWMNTNKSFEIDEVCEETSMLDNINPLSIRVDLSDATIEVKSITFSSPVQLKSTKITEKKKGQRTLQVSEKIEQINKVLKKQNKKWLAGESSIAALSYEEKKNLFGGKLPNLYGFEYYKGGIFELPYDGAEKNTNNSVLKSAGDALPNSPYVAEFDWRDRHGQNWLSPVTNQLGCGSCYIFGAVGATEHMVNLYYNQPLNIDLAEQDILSCGNNNGCDGGSSLSIIHHIQNNGIVNEACFPYVANEVPCSNKCANPTEQLRVGGANVIDVTEDNLKSIIISGAVGASISSWSHALCLAGYKTIQVGDVYDFMSRDGNRTIVIQDGDPLIGKTAWIFKNSWGTGHGDQGYFYIVTDINNIHTVYQVMGPINSMNFNDNDIACNDLDGDGYYNWGVGPKPAHCPPCPEEPDGNDNDPEIGPIDEFGHCTTILQAENATINNGLVESTNSGYTGTGYVNYNKSAGSSIVFNINADGAGKYDCTLRYANGESSAIPMNVLVNGSTVVSNSMFDITGSWSAWQDKEFNLELQDGTNTIEFIAAGGTGGPNTDKLTVYIDDFIIVSNDDNFLVDWNQVNILDVLKNDYDPEGSALAVISFTQPTNGTAALSADTAVSYTPDPNFIGLDSLIYTVTDGIYSLQAKVFIEVADIEDAPIVKTDQGNIFVAPITTKLLYYEDWFYDHDNDELTYSITSSNETAVHASTLNDYCMSLYIVDNGIANINVTASDHLASVTDQFYVIATDNITDPVAVDTIPDHTVQTNEGLVISDVDKLFDDPNGDNLILSCSSNGSSDHLCMLMGTFLILTTPQPDTIIVTLTATDQDGNSASFSFNLYVVGTTAGSELYNPTNTNMVTDNNSTLSMVRNYPNPFNDATTIGFYLSKDSQVRIQLVDISGRFISTIADNNFKTGQNEVVFEKGNLLPGIYFYTIQVDNQIIVKKLVIN